MASEQIAFDFEPRLDMNDCRQSRFAREVVCTTPRDVADATEKGLEDKHVDAALISSDDAALISEAGLISSDMDRGAMLRQLRQQTKCIQHPEVASGVATFSTGVAALDAWLPVGGLRFDAITEWVSDCRGSGAITIALLAAASRLNGTPQKGSERQKQSGGSYSGGPLVVVSAEGDFYPPSAFAFGIPSRQILWVRTQKQQDQVWAIDQALRCKSTAAVLALLPRQLDERDARRFQLASEQGKTPGFFVRSNMARSQPCFAEVRFHVGCCKPLSSHPRKVRDRLQVGSSDDEATIQTKSFRSQAQFLMQRKRQFLITLDRCRGGRVGRQGRFEMNEFGELQEVGFGNREAMNHGKTTMHLVSKLAHPKNSKSRPLRVDFAG